MVDPCYYVVGANPYVRITPTYNTPVTYQDLSGALPQQIFKGLLCTITAAIPTPTHTYSPSNDRNQH